jgi:hypothetical protein
MTHSYTTMDDFFDYAPEPLRNIAIPAEYTNWPRVIGIYSAAPGCGKSTVARVLCETRGYRRVPFAAPLKRVVAEFLASFGYCHTQDIVEQHKDTPLSTLYGLTPRHLLQTLGTEWGRQCVHPDIWVRAWHESVRGLTHVVVDDVRFPNEAVAVRALGGVLWCVDRPGVVFGGEHTSEGALEDVVPDVFVTNAGDVAELRCNVEVAFARSRGLVASQYTTTAPTLRSV